MSTIDLERQIARTQMRIEQMRIHLAMLHPSQRASEAEALEATIAEMDELTQQLKRQHQYPAPKAA
jgi:hypothetical protein